MSGQFKSEGAQRVTEQEILSIRQELIVLLQLDHTDFSVGIDPDFYGNKNLLLPNPIDEKVDYGDIDIFLFYQEGKKSPEVFVKLLEKSTHVLKINKNDHTWSFLYYSPSVNKKVQIDLHMIKNSQQNRCNYFEYYRVPYLYFVLGIVLNRIDIKLGTRGVNYLIRVKSNDSSTVIDKTIRVNTSFPKFLEEIFDINYNDLKKITSYEGVTQILIDKGLSRYDFFDQEMKYEYRQKIKSNEKLQIILSKLPKPEFTVEQFKLDFFTKLNQKYPFLEMQKKKVHQDFLKGQQEKVQREEQLKQIFNVSSLSEISDKDKKKIGLYRKVLSELSILKKMSKKVQESFPNDKIYLVGGAVRDILLGLDNNDWDLCGTLLPEQFQELFQGNITEKYGTVFTKYENLEIEYTPFRIEEGYTGRHIDSIEFTNSLEKDSERRDFTINSMYIDLVNFEIIDLYNGQEDLNKKVLRCVGIAQDRFDEDYLRILRAIRLSSKLNYTIEENTWKAMIKNSKKINLLPGERVLEEYFKGFNLPSTTGGRRYKNKLSEFFEQGCLSDVNLVDTWNKLSKREIYTFLYSTVVHKDLELFHKILGKYRGSTFSYFTRALNLVTRNTELFSRGIRNPSVLLEVLYKSKIDSLSLSDSNKYLSVLLNILISQDLINKVDLSYVLAMKKKLDKMGIQYISSKVRKELGIIDVYKYAEEHNIPMLQFVEFSFNEYLQKIASQLSSIDV